MTTTQQNKQSPKPIEHDIHLKYLCPKCNDSHWLSWQEASTDGFKVVCHCNHVFSVKKPHKFIIRYNKTSKKSNKTISIGNTSHIQKAIRVLKNYGFMENEFSDILTKISKTFPVADCGFLVKETLVQLKGT